VREGAIDREQEFRSRTYLEAIEARLAGRGGARVRAVLLGGRVIVDWLLEHAEALGASLIVMTTHARGGATRMWLGSVADGLVRRSPVPVLLLRPPVSEREPAGERPFARVLLPLDGAPSGNRIIETALEVAGTNGVEYHVVRVLAPLAVAAAEVLHRRGEKPAVRAQQARVETVLESTAEALRARGAAVRVQAITGDGAAASILRYVDEHGMDLVAMTTRSRGGLERWLLGSVADKVLRGASVPLLLLNPEAGAEPG
jgi:nucleotide-binding universal stress UspA family protein